MHEHKDHAEILAGLSKELTPILEYSDDGVYLYLDDHHVVANAKFVKMLGFKTQKEMMGLDFLHRLVDAKSQKVLVEAFWKAVKRMTGSKITVVWKKKGKGIVKTQVILVPITYKGHAFALHFVSKG